MLNDGNINILFGDVVSVEDDQKICRARVRINGYTDQLEDDDLPWYFPFYGLNYLPEEGDVVSVLIFDDCLNSGFYGRKCGLSKSNLSQEDYTNYLEIFKRTINGGPVLLTYKPSSGIEFINDNSGAQIETNKLSLFCASNGITVTDSSIVLGNEDSAQAVLKGDEILKILSSMCDMISDLAKLFSITSSPDIMPTLLAGCSTPFTAAFSPAFTALTTKASMVVANIATLSAGITSATLQSDKVKIE